MKFEQIGISPQQNNSVKENKGIRFRFPFFGVKKGEKIQPLKKDTVQIAISELPIVERELAIAISALSEKSIGSPELFQKFLTKIVKNGTETNPELLVSRTEFLKTDAKEMNFLLDDLIILDLQGNKNTSFLLDNLREINQIFNKKQIPQEQKKGVLALLNEENYEQFCELAKDESLNGEDFAIIAMYNSTKHNIEFGNEIAIVDSSEIVSLLSGVQSLSTMKNNNYELFNACVSSLVDENYRDDNLHYNQIAEGILKQMPKLAMIAKDYNDYAQDIGIKYQNNPEKIFPALNQYFKELDESGLLPQQIELKTIIPDENALLYPEHTLKAFLHSNK